LLDLDREEVIVRLRLNEAEARTEAGEHVTSERDGLPVRTFRKTRTAHGLGRRLPSAHEPPLHAAAQRLPCTPLLGTPERRGRVDLDEILRQRPPEERMENRQRIVRRLSYAVRPTHELGLKVLQRRSDDRAMFIDHANPPTPKLILDRDPRLAAARDPDRIACARM
jgi:hypothetical protein